MLGSAEDDDDGRLISYFDMDLLSFNNAAISRQGFASLAQPVARVFAGEAFCLLDSNLIGLVGLEGLTFLSPATTLVAESDGIYFRFPTFTILPPFRNRINGGWSLISSRLQYTAHLHTNSSGEIFF